MKRKNRKKYIMLASAAAVVLLSACSHGKTANIANSAAEPSAIDDIPSAESSMETEAETAVSGKEENSDEAANTLDTSRIITGQSFDVTWKNWGEVRFVSYAPQADQIHSDVAFYLTKNDETLYEFPGKWDENAAPWVFESVDMVSFRDIDGDENEDVITIISYITGAGAQAAVPFPTTRVFMGDGTKFVLDTELSDSIDAAHANESISTIMDFIKNRTVPVSSAADEFGDTNESGEDAMYETTGIHEADARAFLEKFTAHVKAGEKADASAMISFPKKVILPDGEVIVQNAEEFLAYYDEIFTEDFKERLAQCMEEDSVWWNYMGVALGNGELWLNQRDGSLWIEALNSAEDRAVRYPENTGIQAG